MIFVSSSGGSIKINLDDVRKWIRGLDSLSIIYKDGSIDRFDGHIAKTLDEDFKRKMR